MSIIRLGDHELPRLYIFNADLVMRTRLPDVLQLREEGCILGLSGNYAAVTLRIVDWFQLFSIIGPMTMTMTTFLTQIKSYIRAREYIMVSGESQDENAAQEAGWRYITEQGFTLGTR